MVITGYKNPDKFVFFSRILANFFTNFYLECPIYCFLCQERTIF